MCSSSPRPCSLQNLLLSPGLVRPIVCSRTINVSFWVPLKEAHLSKPRRILLFKNEDMWGPERILWQNDFGDATEILGFPSHQGILPPLGERKTREKK